MSIDTTYPALIADSHHEPRPTSLEPRAMSQEPRAKSQEPRAKSQEPRAKSQEPSAKSQEPRAKSQEQERFCVDHRELHVPIFVPSHRLLDWGDCHWHQPKVA